MKHLVTFLCCLLAAWLCQGQDAYHLKENGKFTSKYNTYCGMTWNGELVMVSDEHHRGASHSTDKQGMEFTHLFVVDSTGEPRPLFEADSRSTHHDGPFCFTNGGKKLYFTSSEINVHNAAGREPFGVFVSVFENGRWQHGKPMKYNSSKYNVGHPAIDKSDSLLVVSMDREDAFGHSDLYYAVRDENGFGDLVHLPAGINTIYSESFAALDDDLNLYFSSNRDSVNGLDIYRSKWDGKSWGTPEKLPAEMNSSKDDFGIHFADNGKGYVSSNRDGKDQIYAFNYDPPKIENCDSLMPNDYCFYFFEPTAMTFDTVPLLYQWDFGDGTRAYGTGNEHCYKKHGEYEVVLNVVDTITKELYMNVASYPLSIEEINYPYIASDDTVLTRGPVLLDASASHITDFKVHKYWWLIDQEKYYSAPAITHSFQSDGQHEVALMVTSKPDSAGAYESKCIHKYVYSSSNENEVAMYSKNLEAIEQRIQHMSDTTFALIFYSVELETAQENEIVGNFDVIEEKYEVDSTVMKGVKSYHVGEADTPVEVYDVYKDAKEVGYRKAHVKGYPKENILDIDKLDKMQYSDILNKRLILTTAQFESGEFDLTREMKVDLMKIAPLLTRISAIRMEISAFTDGDGTDLANQRLSDKRAAAVADYYVDFGILKERISHKGYGEQFLLNDDETEEEKNENRRIEIKFVK